MTNELTIENKGAFYAATIEGNLELYKMYVNGTEKQKPFNIFEEVSAAGYYWTTFHYAMHYGKWNIISFIIETLTLKGRIDIGLKLKVNDGRCPLLCLLKSNILKPEQKRNIFDKIITNFVIPISDEVRSILELKGFKDLAERAKDKKYSQFEY